MPARPVISGQAIPLASGVTLLARIQGQGGALVTQASLTSVGYVVSNLTTGLQVGSGAPVAASCIYDSLQIDPRWTVDSQAQPGPDGRWGYNFALVLPAALFPLAALAAPDLLAGGAKGQRYQADVTLTPVLGPVFRQIFSWMSLPTFG